MPGTPEFFATNDVDVENWIFFCIVVAFAGTSMGMVGVGGVIIVPAAIAFLKIDPKTAISSTIPGYLITSLVGTITYSSILKKIFLINNKKIIYILVGCGGGSTLAAIIIVIINKIILSIGVSILTIVFGFKSILQVYYEVYLSISMENDAGAEAGAEGEESHIVMADEQTKTETESDLVVVSSNVNVESESLTHTATATDTATNTTTAILTTENIIDICIGILIGLGSGLTGTSGPLFTIPLLLMIYPSTIKPIEAVAYSLCVGIPISILFTITSQLLQTQTQAQTQAQAQAQEDRNGNGNGNGNGNEDAVMDWGISLMVGLLTGSFVPLGKYISSSLEKRYGNSNGNSNSNGNGNGNGNSNSNSNSNSHELELELDILSDSDNDNDNDNSSSEIEEVSLKIEPKHKHKHRHRHSGKSCGKGKMTIDHNQMMLVFIGIVFIATGVYVLSEI
jgi:uncharacterized membrane protein YfcA